MDGSGKGTRLENKQRFEELRGFQARIGFAFEQIDLLDQALTHSSYVNETVALDALDNQRLEFLGDALLDFTMAHWLYDRYPGAHEGDLTSLRADIVRTEGLAAFAREIGMGELMLLGRGEALNGGATRAANLCAAFEALVGAMYVDRGLEATEAWFLGILSQHAAEIDSRFKAKDPKSLLQEYTQGAHHVTPWYRVVDEAGPDHAKVFTAQVLLDDEVWGEGQGGSKRAAEQAAAQNALDTHIGD